MSRRRTSSVGNINLGDTKVHSLGTMHSSKYSLKASQNRLNALSTKPSSDTDVVNKFYLSYVELAHRNTWLTPLIILFIVGLAYLSSGNYTETNPLHMFVAVSYNIPGTDMYAKGPKDLCFIAFYMIFFTFLREFVMQIFIRPLTVWLGVTKPAKINRMMEQCYSIFYYGVSGPCGIYLMYHSDLWLFATKTMYATYPDLNNPYLYKIFYLGQAAFWAQQAAILVLQVEKPRKDFKELVFHHIVTLALIWLSYVFHFSKMGLAVYITMDVSDFWLALSKTLNYLDCPVTVPVFLIFLVNWIYLRHYINLRILWSVLTEFSSVGDFRLNFATQQYKCWISQPIVFVLIAALQLVNLYWLFLILRILYRIIFLNIQKDERSDSDTEDEPLTPVEEEPKKDI